MLYIIYIEDNKHLNKLCDDLINFKITVEDIFEQEESVVSSTESSPVKVPTSSKAKAKKSASQRVLGLAKQMSSGRKSMEILSAISPNERPVVGSKRSLSSTPCTSKAAIDTATIRARQIFSSQDADTPNYDSDSEDEDVGISANEKLTEALEEIKRLKKQLNKSESMFSTCVYV